MRRLSRRPKEQPNGVLVWWACPCGARSPWIAAGWREADEARAEIDSTAAEHRAVCPRVDHPPDAVPQSI